MAFRSQKETYDSNTPSDLSSRKSMNGAPYRRSSKLASKATKIRSYRGSISNSSVHTTSTVATRKDVFDCSEQSPGGDPSVSHRKSLHSLEKPTIRFRNQSQSTVGTVREAGSVRSSAATPTSRQEIRSLNKPSFEDEDESPQSPTPRSSIYNLSTLPEPIPSSSRVYDVSPSVPLDDPLTKPYEDGDYQPFVTTGIPTDDKPTTRHPSSLPPPTATNHKVYDPSSPFAPSSRRTPKITAEYHKPSRQSSEEYQDLLRNAKMHAAAAESYKDPFVPLTQAPPPPSSHNASRPSRGQQKAASSVPRTLPHSSQMNRVNLAESYADPNPMAVLGTAPTAPLDGVSEVSHSHTPADSIGINLRSRGGTVSTKGKKGMLGFVTDFLNSHKRPEISTPYDPVHLTHVGFNSSTGECTDLPNEWQQLLEDSGISKSDQERNPRAVMENVKFYQEGGGDVWDKMGRTAALGSSQSPAIPGTIPPAFPGLSKYVDDSFVSTRRALPPPKKAHSGGPHGPSTLHPPGSYRPAPSSSQPDLDQSNSQRSVPKPPRSDTLIRANTTKDRRSLRTPTSVKESAREKPNSSTADPTLKSQPSEIDTLSRLRSKYEAGGMFDPDWKPSTAPLAPQPPGDLPPDQPPVPPPEPRQGAWRSAYQRGGFRRPRKKSEGPPAGPVIGTTPPATPPPDRAQTTATDSWPRGTWHIHPLPVGFRRRGGFRRPHRKSEPPPAVHIIGTTPPATPPPDRAPTVGSWAPTWQVQGVEDTPPPSEPVIHLEPETQSPRLFGPRSPRKYLHD